MSSTRSKLKGAVIGCGFVSQFHLAAWKLVEDIEVVAVCDLDAQKRSQALERAPGATALASAEELFSLQKLDFVEICTGPESHRSLVELSARHGTHVLCQKPSARDRDDLHAMIEACKTANVCFMIHENWRFRPWYRALRAELNRGSIGRPIRLLLSHRDNRSLRPDGYDNQPFFREMPQLILFEMGPHLVDIARFLMGEATEVSACFGNFGATQLGEDVAMLTLRFQSGAIALLDMSWCSSSDQARPEWALNQTRLEGSTGVMTLQRDGSFLRIDHAGSTHQVRVSMPPDEEVYLDAYLKTQSHFIDSIKNQTEPETSGEDNLRTMEIIWAGYQSARDQRVIRLESL